MPPIDPLAMAIRAALGFENLDQKQQQTFDAFRRDSRAPRLLDEVCQNLGELVADAMRRRIGLVTNDSTVSAEVLDSLAAVLADWARKAPQQRQPVVYGRIVNALNRLLNQRTSYVASSYGRATPPPSRPYTPPAPVSRPGTFGVNPIAQNQAAGQQRQPPVSPPPPPPAGRVDPNTGTTAAATGPQNGSAAQGTPPAASAPPPAPPPPPGPSIVIRNMADPPPVPAVQPPASESTGDSQAAVAGNGADGIPPVWAGTAADVAGDALVATDAKIATDAKLAAGAARSTKPSIPPTPVTPVAQWKCLPVPDGPDKHTESDARAAEAPRGLRYLAARARGKKHKHEGTNCDDWFEVRIAGPWTVVAVSDGAGSKKFSRVGAQAACEKAAQFLCDKLTGHVIAEGDAHSVHSRDDATATRVFANEAIEFVQKHLHEAVNVAYDALKSAHASRVGNEEYTRILNLNRPLDINDLSCTLLLVVHAIVKFQDKDHSFVMSCQVGDGMTGFIGADARLQLLGEPDSGEFSGETEFLTSANRLQPANLAKKTFACCLPMRALLVMTDGVADDYFPNDPGLLRLHGDLVLNGITPWPGSDEAAVGAALAATKLPDAAAVAGAMEKFISRCERVGEGPREQVPVRSASLFAEQLGIDVSDLCRNPALLLAGSAGKPTLCDSALPPEQMLLTWLDSYYVRSSFDDRTLVVLYREGQT